MANNLSNSIKTTRVANASAAGTTAVNSSSVNMTNFDGVRFTIGFGAIVSTAVTSVNAAQSSDDSSFADLEGSSISVADDDDNQVVVLDIWRPVDKFVRVEVAKDTANSTVDFIIAEQYGPRVLPTTDDASTVVAREIHASPAEGTA